ncbi:TIGR03009 domain-containing protein [Thermostilla marina]
MNRRTIKEEPMRRFARMSCVCVGVLWFACAATGWAQAPYPPQGNQAYGRPGYAGQPGAVPAPNQPVVPNDPRLERRTGPAPQEDALLPPPFQLTPYEQAQLDRVLAAWEQRSKQIQNFECEFTRWEFDPVNGPQNAPKRICRGKVMYSAPDKGLFLVDKEAVGDRYEDSPHPERWVCDGKSVYEYRYETKQIVETPLPPELQGKSITEGPLPFLFGAEAESLKRRYFMRLITPANVKDEIWIEALPRHQREAANFSRAHIILKYPTMDLFALQVFYPSAQPSTQQRVVFQIENPKINRNDFFQIFKRDPFQPYLPDHTWAKTVNNPQSQPNQALGVRPSVPRR